MKHTLVCLFIFAALISHSFANKGSLDPFQSGFYLGQTSGVSHLYGKRTDFIDFQQPAYTNGFIAEDTEAYNTHLQVTAFLGYLYRFSDSRWVIGLEPTVTYDDQQHKVQTSYDPGAGSTIFFQAHLKRTWEVSLPLRIGYLLPNDFLIYGLAGVSRSDFEYEVIKEELMTAGVTKHDNRRVLWGVIYGFGLEKEIAPIRIGIEVKNTHYQKRRIVATEDDTLFILTPKVNVLVVDFRISFLL